MALFPRWSNAALLYAIALVVLGASAAIAAPLLYIRTPYGTHLYKAVEQPIEFDHRHHVQDEQIDCLYCHSGARSEALAGIPSTDVCMGCHAQVWIDSPLLAPVQASYFERAPIAWARVYTLPDFVYFHHGVHVQRGIACARCHGDVGEMARVARMSPLTMQWCLDCHRHPPPPFPSGRAITPLTTCTACHR